MSRQAHVIIYGRVQGVFFRAQTKQKADSLGLKGWVRNLASGGVEAVFIGQGHAIRSMLDWCQSGPSLARVTNLEVTWDEPKEIFADFQIR
jgi:acylphosphatase